MNDIDFLKQKEVVSFIQDNSAADVNNLLLNPPGEFKDGIKPIADQIQSRQKAVGKLSDWLENSNLIFPPPVSIEQASSLSTSKFKKNLVEGDLLVDLTGGTGIDILALSESFKRSVYVEQNPWLCQVFAHNLEVLNKEIRVENRTAEEFLKEFQDNGVFFIDPARRDQSSKKVFRLEDCVPNVMDLIPTLRAHATEVLVKLSPLLDLTSALQAIPHVKDIYVLSVRNDCKELLLHIDFRFSGEATIHAVNLETSQPTFVFTQSEEMGSTRKTYEAGRYLYEPNASILKAGAFKSVANTYALQKISPNTHLYRASELKKEFPGKVFEIIEQKGKEHLQYYAGIINVITRNYPLTTSALKKKYRLRDGGSDFLIGYRDEANKPQLIIAKRHF